jgi:hypothetical protein
MGRRERVAHHTIGSFCLDWGRAGITTKIEKLLLY